MGGVRDAGSTCITDIQLNGYAFGNAPPCSACKENAMSLNTKCRAMIDCLEPLGMYTAGQRLDCFNRVGGSGPLDTCISALINASCGM